MTQTIDGCLYVFMEVSSKTIGKKLKNCILCRHLGMALGTCLPSNPLPGYEKLDPYHAETLTTATALALLRQEIGKPHKAEDVLQTVKTMPKED